MIINIRGTHGSGKSTVIRSILNRYSAQPIRPLGSRRPLGYEMNSPFGKLAVVGHYETDCGGCDAIQPYAEIWPRVEAYHRHAHVLFEGALVSNSYGNIGRASEELGDQFVFAFLDTPLRVCVDRILERRQARGNLKPFDPNKSVVRIYNSNLSVMKKVQQYNRKYVIINYCKAVSQILGLLNSTSRR